MNEKRREALRKHRQDLRGVIQVENILPALCPWLTDVEYSRVSEREDNVAKVDELINILLATQVGHFDSFCVALEQNGYGHLAKTLQKEVEDIEG